MHPPLFTLLLLSPAVTMVNPLLLLQEPPLDCSQQGLNCSVKINSCTDAGWVKSRMETPSHPFFQPCDQDEDWGTEKNQRGDLVPVLLLCWRPQSDAGLLILLGTEVQIWEEFTNQSLCIRYLFHNRLSTFSPDMKPWSFSIKAVSVNPAHNYVVLLNNLPKPNSQEGVKKTISVPDCRSPRMQNCKVCVERGSLWKPHLTWSVENTGRNQLLISFRPWSFSEEYKLAINSTNSHHSHTLWKENRTVLNDTFHIDLYSSSHCRVSIMIQPLSQLCATDCLDHWEKVNVCDRVPPPVGFAWMLPLTLGFFILSAGLVVCFVVSQQRHPQKATSPGASANPSPGQSGPVKMSGPSRVLILYSLDHALYKEIVLKLSAFLRAKCATEVTLDLLDSAELGAVGRVQWLEMQRERVRGSFDKILILCSRGVGVKWKAMCGGPRVTLREDVHSPLGDMLSPALSLIVPEFVRLSSFQKYLVAYFEDVSCEADIPSPFHITVKYKLMKHVEELFFRLLDQEQYQPGRVKRVLGIAEDDYFQCPSGKALRDAVEAFQAYQLSHPNWFEMEIMESEDDEEAAKLNPFAPSVCRHHLKCHSGNNVSMNAAVPEERRGSYSVPHVEKKFEGLSTLKHDQTTCHHGTTEVRPLQKKFTITSDKSVNMTWENH
ncbi:interleukin-17 receptor A [Denticeps clupeoides]|uniref:interleukin-17 receptor A n=1 Tax=Denticeps clupeoides TaxID=299321 RepID=UPI0010A5747F|nr:interleukin-17 receptor A-like [Denticeps clupeoides]